MDPNVTGTGNAGDAADDGKDEKKTLSPAERKKAVLKVEELADKLKKNSDIRAKLKAEEKVVLQSIFGDIGPQKFKLPTSGEVVSVMKRRPKGGGEPMYVLRGKNEEEVLDFG